MAMTNNGFMKSEFAYQWDHLRTFEATARLRSLTAAARFLGISQSTVSRHLRALEKHAGSPLVFRESPARLTERGTALLAAVLPMVDAALAAQSALEDVPELCGEVTIATVAEVLRWHLTLRLEEFYTSYPRLRLRILTGNFLSSLAAGEADLALRFVRPERGEMVALKLRSESYAVFAPADLDLHAETPWLGLAGSLAEIPEQRHAELLFASRPPRLLVEDVESLGLAVQAGLGVAILPCSFAARLPGVVEVRAQSVGGRDLGPMPSRDLWMVVHPSRERLPKVRAVMKWIRAELARP